MNRANLSLPITLSHVKNIMPDDVISEDKPTDEKKLAEVLTLYQIHANLVSMTELKRQQANQIYIAIVSALIAGGTAITSTRAQLASQALDFFSVSVLVICMIWYLTMLYYRRLSRAKFEVLTSMEENFSIKPFCEEWKHFKNPTLRPRAVELTKVEASVPIALSVCAIALLALRHFPLPTIG